MVIGIKMTHPYAMFAIPKKVKGKGFAYIVTNNNQYRFITIDVQLFWTKYWSSDGFTIGSIVFGAY